MDNKKTSKIFICNKCNYNTSRNSQWQRHIATSKHLMDNNIVPDVFECICGNTYIYQSGLCKHKKKCEAVLNLNKKPNYKQYFSSNEDMIQAVLKDNQEFKQLLIEQNAKIMELASTNKVITNNNNNITNNNTTNNFNMQMFLNVECKDALNMSEFVDSLQVKIQDLEATGRLGYVEGISNIFLNGLKGLDINKRPIHCSDQKRETLYIKDKDIWEKDTDDRHKIKTAIKMITAKNIRQIPLWQKENPEWRDSSSKVNDRYLRIVSNAMNGSTVEETQKNYDKIISKLAKSVVIQK
jgi:hypothetical protein